MDETPRLQRYLDVVIAVQTLLNGQYGAAAVNVIQQGYPRTLNILLKQTECERTVAPSTLNAPCE
ncbi:hypothetical protein PC120_g24713 [Phytophthora cactorum]|nr:hypothetical protein PC120_g24713 [Phytophthora cactorum]